MDLLDQRDPARDILRTVFGFEHFRPGQEEIVRHLAGGRDAFVLMPTGGGKSLCFQIPALLREGLGVVVSPLISLMKNQVDALRQAGVRAATLNSSLTPDERRRCLAQVRAEELDLLYVSPERLMTEGMLEVLDSVPLALFAIDEAHCVSQWGHDFRPEYVQLGGLRARFPGVPTAAFTATADEQTRDDVLSRLALREARVFVSGFDRPNIRYTVVEKENPALQLARFVAGRSGEAGIVYCLSRNRTEQVAEALTRRGVPAAAYHAGLPAGERTRVQDAFDRDEVLVVVATVAFGLGIDKSNVRFVVHYDMPKSIESYYQETGRAGRDGLPAEALLLYSPADLMLSRALIEQGGNAEQVRVDLHKLRSMGSFAEALACRRRALLGYFGETRYEDCGNCDICLDPPEWFDGTEDAQKVLSCVYRLGQSFGLVHVVDVLRGAATERIRELGHDRLSTYGIGAHRTKPEWRSIVNQLIHLGYLRQDIARYSVLRLTAAARPVLRGDRKITLARPRRAFAELHRAENRSRQKSAPAGAAPTSEGDAALFDHLRSLRRRIADEQGVPAYVVFGDSALVDMAARRPLTPEEFLEVHGVGRKKLEAYGELFLEAIAGFDGAGGAASDAAVLLTDP